MAVTAAQREMAQMLLAEYCRTGDRQQLAVLDDVFAGSMGGLTAKEQDDLLESTVAVTEAEPRRWSQFIAEYFIIWPRRLNRLLRTMARHAKFLGMSQMHHMLLLEHARKGYWAERKRWSPEHWRGKTLSTAIELVFADRLVIERADQKWQALWAQDFGDCTDKDDLPTEHDDWPEFYVCYIIEVHNEDEWLNGDMTLGDIEQQGIGEVLTSLGCIELPKTTAHFHQMRRQTERDLMMDLAMMKVQDDLRSGNRPTVDSGIDAPAGVIDLLAQVHAAVR